jgi:hypothetical protein
MKNKMLLPLLAVVFAFVGAFASTPFAQQMAWFKPLVGSAQQGTITVPANTDTNPCTTGGTIQCTVNGRNAYDTEAHANAAPDAAGLLKYN